MPCYHPLRAIQSPTPNANGKHPIFFPSDINTISETEFLSRQGSLLIPCGNCVGCRLDYSRQWAIRCIFEAKLWTDNHFITLTYAVPPISKHVKVDEDTGQVLLEEDVMSLLPSDLTKFLKDLRAYYKYHYDFEGIRFFGCGEYGDKNKRPHYHVILFNCPIFDLYEVDEPSSTGLKQWSSHVLEDIWKHGLVRIGEVTFESCAYVARYIMKKHKGKDAHYYDENGLIPEFVRMSRKPGIARHYFDENFQKIYYYDQVTFLSSKGIPLTVKPPKYYDRIFDEYHPDSLASIKEKRKTILEDTTSLRVARSGVSQENYLNSLEDLHISRASTLFRDI